jgi:hypothetical protein
MGTSFRSQKNTGPARRSLGKGAKDEIFRRIGVLGVIPILTLKRAQDAEWVVVTLLDAELPCAEVTLCGARSTGRQ